MAKKIKKIKKPKFKNFLKRSYLVPALVISLVAGLTALGAFLLVIVGQSLIKEAVQEVSIKDKTEARSDGVGIGDRAPHFELPDLVGDTNSPSDFLDKPLTITFWSTWNSISADQIKIFDDYLAKDTKPIFAVVAINNQENSSVVESFIRRGGYKLKVLLDEVGAVGELYKVTTLPLTYFIDKEGVIQDAFTGILSEEMLLEKSEKIIR